MTRQKVGLILSWLGFIYAILWGVIGSISATSTMNSLTGAEFGQTIWGTGPLMIILLAFGVPLGTLVAGIGLLLYSGAKGSTVWKFGIGILLVLIVGIGTVGRLGHFPPLFGIGGTLILLLFIGNLWLWTKERIALKGLSTTAADFTLVGYVFMLTAVWFVCSTAARPFFTAFEGPPGSPVHVIVFFVLGWLFLFLGHYKSRHGVSSS
ncbi:hypothetical protein ACFLV6_00275 [Chloroflexota bacterium]